MVGNAIRTGYNAATGAIKTGMKTITRSITEGFTKMSGGKGNNLFSKISNGAKNLFSNAKTKLKEITPKFRAGTEGTVNVYDMDGVAQMSSSDATKLQNIKAGTLKASDISGQTLGSAEGFFTKAGQF